MQPGGEIGLAAPVGGAAMGREEMAGVVSRRHSGETAAPAATLSRVQQDVFAGFFPAVWRSAARGGAAYSLLVA